MVIDGELAIQAVLMGDEYLGRKNSVIGRQPLTGSSCLFGKIGFDGLNSQHALEIKYDPSLFPEIKQVGTVAAQVITSGPDTEHEEIKMTYLKMINLAKRKS